MTTFHAIVAVLLLTSCAPIGPASFTAWEYTCLQMELYEASCEALTPPAVVYTSLVERKDAIVRGVYIHGEHQVFVHPDTPDKESTVIHEFAHYIFYENGMKERCKQEEIVRFIAGQPWNRPLQLLYSCPLT